MKPPDPLADRLLALLARRGPAGSRELAELARAPLHSVRHALGGLSRRDLIERRGGAWCMPAPGHAAWPAVDRVLHGMPPDPLTPNRRRPAGTTSKDRR